MVAAVNFTYADIILKLLMQIWRLLKYTGSLVKKEVKINKEQVFLWGAIIFVD